jgi:hypothetical protein
MPPNALVAWPPKAQWLRRGKPFRVWQTYNLLLLQGCLHPAPQQAAFCYKQEALLAAKTADQGLERMQL